MMRSPAAAAMYTEPSEMLASALDGEPEALRRLAVADQDGRIGASHRIAAALYLRATRAGIEGPALVPWRQALFMMSARYLALGAAVEHIAQLLAAEKIRWIPLKGYDLATRIYDPPEERQTSDLDLLVASQDFERARRKLVAAGWQGLAAGEHAEEYLQEEGYAWQATDGVVLLELHFRLWGSVAEGLEQELIANSRLDPALPTGGHRLSLAHAYAIAAVHAWLTDPPRPIASWWDLARISAASSPELVDEVEALSRRFGLELPIALAAQISATLWGQKSCQLLATRQAQNLRLPERWLARRTAAVGDTPLASMALARLLAGRPSRTGWRAPWRKLWAHPGTIERFTPTTWPWAARRLWYLLLSLGFEGTARRLEKRLETQAEG